MSDMATVSKRFWKKNLDKGPMDQPCAMNAVESCFIHLEIRGK